MHHVEQRMAIRGLASADHPPTLLSNNPFDMFHCGSIITTTLIHLVVAIIIVIQHWSRIGIPGYLIVVAVVSISCRTMLPLIQYRIVQAKGLMSSHVTVENQLNGHQSSHPRATCVVVWLVNHHHHPHSKIRLEGGNTII